MVSATESVCRLCGSDGKWEVDHIQALALGGGDERSNLRRLCVPCHRERHPDARCPDCGQGETGAQHVAVCEMLHDAHQINFVYDEYGPDSKLFAYAMM